MQSVNWSKIIHVISEQERLGNHNVETLHDRPKGSKDLTVVVPLSGYFVLTQKTIADRNLKLS